MLEKIRSLSEDPLFYHKVGLLSGAVVGLLVGLYISGKAEDYDMSVLEEVMEVGDGPEEN